MSNLKDLKQDTFDFYAQGASRRQATNPHTRSYDRPTLLWERIGKFIGQFFANKIDFNTDECVPSIVFRIKREKPLLYAELLDVIFETEGISMTEANSKYEEARKFGIIGYDTEFLPEHQPPQMLSHQFCIDAGKGKRFGIVLDTDIRFTDTHLLKFLGCVVAAHTDYSIKQWNIFAHFSLVEGSWTDSSGVKLIERERKEWKGKLIFHERPKLTKAGKPSMRNKEPVTEKLWLRFADTTNLDMRSLKASAETCGLEKYAILPLKYQDRHWFKKCCSRVYDKMDRFQARRPGEFYRYGVRDAIITAGVAIVLHSKFGADSTFQVRTAMYSEKHMFEWFSKNYKGIHRGWQQVLGQHKITWPSKTPGKKDFEKWEPEKLQKVILMDWYKGGRNEAKQVGCFEKQVSYFDMTSAYPTSLAAMRTDFDFGTPIVRTRNDRAEERIKQLMHKGPFQPHGVKAYIRFKPDCKVPMAPVSADSGIIYPIETEGQVVCWPEYWVAKKLGIIEEEFVLAFYEFRALESRKLPDYILEMLKRRKEEKVFFKSILNYLSGKFAQGRRDKVPYSSISCPALAAYLTSTTRAAAAEVGNLNEYYAITTDGIISPEKELKYKKDGINERLAKRLEPIGFTWMKNEFTGDKAVVWKTRGYILFDSTSDGTDPDKPKFKQAKMGLQGEEPADFIKQIKTGKGVRRSVKTFAKLDAGEVFSFFDKEFNVNPSFDFKYAIEPDTIKDATIEMDGVELTMPNFNTRSLRNINEYYDLRRISNWKLISNLAELDKKELSSKNLRDLVFTATLNDRRCRHMVWEFNKRLVKIVPVKETTLHANTHRVWKDKPLYPIPSSFGDISDFFPILREEAKIIKDENRRTKIIDQVIEQMKNHRSKS